MIGRLNSILNDFVVFFMPDENLIKKQGKLRKSKKQFNSSNFTTLKTMLILSKLF